ncbi:MAG: 50S ribosomal protein L19 [Candidatus Shikimatogenerans sp. JK-2022]|nr:50S ribosomal protein L19 [Candidatus Shikimatogenerans bostrichidophilus]
MKNKIINYLEKKYFLKKEINYNFNIGDNISIFFSNYNEEKIINKKKKYQIFTGYVISIKGNNKFNKTFILRKIINNIGVEITFFLYSKNIKKILINKKGKVRKSKLYYIRKKYSNKIKIKEKK